LFYIICVELEIVIDDKMNNIDNKTPLGITERACNQVKNLIEQEGNKALMLRLSVSGGGCSGFSYTFSLDDTAKKDDFILKSHGVSLVIDNISADLLDGSEIDYVDDLLASSFRVNNPNATSTCGCGTSFSM
jgi:iron-sulfur cluster insertion protein